MEYRDQIERERNERLLSRRNLEITTKAKVQDLETRLLTDWDRILPRVRATSTMIIQSFGNEIRAEHLDPTPQSLIPLTDMIAETLEGDGERIAHWLTHAPFPEAVLADGWQDPRGTRPVRQM